MNEPLCVRIRFASGPLRIRFARTIDIVVFKFASN